CVFSIGHDLLCCLHAFPTRRSSDLDPVGGHGWVRAGRMAVAAHTSIIGFPTEGVWPSHTLAGLCLRAPACYKRTHRPGGTMSRRDRKSTRLNSSHGSISYAVFCLKK